MPITSFASYRPTTLEFASNWELANGELGAEPILLTGNYDRAQFVTDRTALLDKLDLVTDRAAQSRTAAANRDTAKAAMLERSKQFRGTVQGQVANKDYLRELPTAPPMGGTFDTFTTPLRAMTRLWTRINDNAATLGLAGPLVLAGGYTLAQFQTDLTALVALYDATESSDTALGQARAERTNLANAIYERMKQYRAIAPAKLPKNSPALVHLPRLTPPPGTTPPPLVVTGVWDQQFGKARLTWAASTATHLEKLQVRGCTGTYKNEDEEVLEDLAANATHWESDWGLTVPGAIASFKVYVMTTTGNENGGKAVKIVRPEV